jgi:hypothetical protein
VLGKNDPWAWRYKFDKETGVCLYVEDRSLDTRFPLDCDHALVRGNHQTCVKMPYEGGVRKSGLCEQAQKRINRWHRYLQGELGL